MDSDVPKRPRDVPAPARAAIVIFFLYLFLVGIGLLEAGISGLGEGFQEGLLASVSHPISGICAGLLATVLVQSSSVSTSTIVGMVGAGTLPLQLAVPMIMGANIGTTVTSTLAALGSIRRADEFQRAFAAATIHDFFNILAVVIILPIELSTRVLSRAAIALTEIFRETNVSELRTSPIRAAVKLPVQFVEGLIGPGGSWKAVLILAVGLALIFLALSMITGNMRRLVAGGVERVMNRVIGRGGGVIGIIVGVGITVAVQSSSITTSILVPLVAAGVLTLRNAYPMTLGANIGTTITALIASLAVLLPEGLTIAFVHVLFNLIAVTVIYGVPGLRTLPIRLAEGLSAAAAKQHRIVFAYAVTLFIVLPLLGVFLIQ